MGLKVYSDNLNFTYNDQPLSQTKLTVGSQEVDVSAYAPYSGNTDFGGVSGELVNLIGPGGPDWALASGKIAVLNVTNSPIDLRKVLALWPGQPEWYVQTGIPTSTADAKIANLTAAAEAGVKGVIYVWDHITSGNLYGQYTPFKRLYQGTPTVYVTGDSGKAIIAAAEAKDQAQLILTDGTNAVEENGHIALLAKAKDLVTNPPKRTTVIVFVTGHMHQPAFSTTGRATSRWLKDNPHYWRGEEGGMTAVASTCVEHLGAVEWVEDLSTNSYHSSGNQSDEWIYANTPELVTLMEENWNGAYPGFLRVNNPIPKGTQAGEGEPLTDEHIPNIALITVPLYLTTEFPSDFDERQLVDVYAMKRQIDSFLSIWAKMDTMPSGSFGTVPDMA
ncbi:hypothetical protein LTR70_000922 [Exophiala xenobiotica]|uniref:Uncharacterized protein n=1 Tax=Lithohypha guttulata TaxID=1690604 RepID=A0ABR0KM53_9EURO|nr:hypothetical protein LTR24_001585 [Lithohypha guttulata]KAK5329086.1 hypothetical protein LTR70_000922 [Exophiala xenobiotica]